MWQSTETKWIIPPDRRTINGKIPVIYFFLFPGIAAGWIDARGIRSGMPLGCGYGSIRPLPDARTLDMALRHKREPVEPMWKELWNKWTIDKPAALGDWLWDVFVVQLAALLERLTLRQIIAFIPVVILILAYAHRIPIPPELMLVGDLLAYIDIFSVLFLLSVLSSAATILFIVKRATGRAGRRVTGLLEGMRRLDFRHRRESGAKNRKRLTNRGEDDDDKHVVIPGVAWA